MNEINDSAVARVEVVSILISVKDVKKIEPPSPGVVRIVISSEDSANNLPVAEIANNAPTFSLLPRVSIVTLLCAENKISSPEVWVILFSAPI